MKLLKIILVAAIAIAATSTATAQQACDKLFSSGVKLQQTMTTASQNKAIKMFERARTCYDSQAKKDLCDQQIKACRNIIARLKADSNRGADEVTPDKPVADNPAAGSAETPQPVAKQRDVKLSVADNYLKFKGKGDEFKKTKVDCNYDDWTVTEHPDWVKCSKNSAGELVVEVDKNPSSKEERSGVIKIECGDKSVTLTIIQERFKKLKFI